MPKPETTRAGDLDMRIILSASGHQKADCLVISLELLFVLCGHRQRSTESSVDP